MPRIQSIEVLQSERLILRIRNDGAHPDKDMSNKIFQPLGQDIIYDGGSGSYSPAVVVQTRNFRFYITVVDVSDRLKNRELHLESSAETVFSMVGRKSNRERDRISAPGVVVFEMWCESNRGDGDTPWCFGKTQFILKAVEANKSSIGFQVLESVPLDPVPMELYFLQHTIPTYFDGTLPLLLLRMFVGAATTQGISKASDWVALVVKICHGSAAPMTGQDVQTKDHWLKYNIFTGTSQFVVEDVNPALPYNNYGGYFSLDAWLEAYRNFRSQNVVTKVNCLDQTAAVELALSLGIEYNKIAWEYHRYYGFISNKAQLVGWGPCNNPYFRKGDLSGPDPDRRLVPAQDMMRVYFRNHAFLSWSPDFRPQLVPNFFKDNPDPVKYTKVKMLAIDACAGPFIGNLERGQWVHPAKYPPNYADRSTYWRSRDDDYNRLINDGHEELLNDDEYPDHHNWTSGITRLSTDPFGATYIRPKDPFKDSRTPLPNPSSFAQWKDVAGGTFANVQTAFRQSLKEIARVGDDWKQLPTFDTLLPSGVIQREFALHGPEKDSMKYFSLRTTVTRSLTDAISLQNNRAAQTIIAGWVEIRVVEKGVNTAPEGEKQKLQMLHVDCLSSFVYLNILVEVSGHAERKILRALAEKLATKMKEFRAVDASKWKDFWK